jgi:glutamyl-tRNA synthetase
MIVRFAPSPTGYLHIGGARTAIFNWLYTRSSGGRFLLRIEDTDRQRSSDEMTREILGGLRWLGIDWDGEPLIQSERIVRHAAECHRLLTEGNAYWCYCTAEELDARRRSAEAAGGAFLYDGTCRNLGSDQRAANDAEGKPRVLRFLVPEGRTVFNDIVHDETSFNNQEIDDFVILRSDGTPTYMVAVVVDDHDMAVTHVLRGDDHLSNTPKQIMLYHGLGYETPQFGHLPLILGEDRKRLSKRHGATSVGEFQQRGYLPEAVFNFLALLGWSPGEDREVLTRDELVESFDIRRVLKKSSVFDEEKLRWMNGRHIRLMDDDELLRRVLPYRPDDLVGVDIAELRVVIPLMKERMVLLQDFFENGRYFWRDPEEYEADAIAKRWKTGIPELLTHLLHLLETVEFTAEALEALIRNTAEQRGLSAGKVIHPIRLALTGTAASPSLFDMMTVLGRDTCVRRLRQALERIPAQTD